VPGADWMPTQVPQHRQHGDHHQVPADRGPDIYVSENSAPAELRHPGAGPSPFLEAQVHSTRMRSWAPFRKTAGTVLLLGVAADGRSLPSEEPARAFQSCTGESGPPRYQVRRRPLIMLVSTGDPRKNSNWLSDLCLRPLPHAAQSLSNVPLQRRGVPSVPSLGRKGHRSLCVLQPANATEVEPSAISERHDGSIPRIAEKAAGGRLGAQDASLPRSRWLPFVVLQVRQCRSIIKENEPPPLP
jgi:hypothetical protein